jgi:hypothetical protein
MEQLRIFGYPVYIHVPVEKRTKLEPSGKKGIFVGYSETSKAYRIFIPTQRKIIVSKDVKFDENLASSKSHELPPVAEDEEQEALKGEQCSRLSVQRVNLRVGRRTEPLPVLSGDLGGLSRH